MSHVWGVALEKNEDVVVALEGHANTLDALFKKQDSLIAYAEQITAAPKFTLSLAMEGDSLMQSGNLVKLHFQASGGKQRQIAMEEVGVGVISLIAAAIAAVGVLIWKFVKWVKNGFGGGERKEPTHGGAAMTVDQLGSAQTAVKLLSQELEYCKPEIEKGLAEILKMTSPSGTSAPVAPNPKGDAPAGKRNVRLELIDLEKAIPGDVRAVYGSGGAGFIEKMKEMANLIGKFQALKEETGEFETPAAFGNLDKHADPFNQLTNLHGQASHEELQAALASLKKYNQDLKEHFKPTEAIIRELTECTRAMKDLFAKAVEVKIDALWVDSVMHQMVAHLSDPAEINFAKNKDAESQKLELSAKTLETRYRTRMEAFFKKVTDNPELVAEAKNVPAHHLQSLKHTIMAIAQSCQVTGRYQKALIDGAASLAKVFDLVELVYRDSPGKPGEKSRRELADMAKKAATMLRAFHHSPTTFKKAA